MPQSSPQFWRLSDQKRGLGLHCAVDGLFLAGTPLLERQTTGFTARRQGDLETVLSRGYGFSVSLNRVIGGLNTVASALNAGDLYRARIAAVHLRIPPLPDTFARLDMQLEDVALKLNRIAKTAAADDWDSAGGEWDPDKHPRTGTAPNAGWFAPTGGATGDDAVQPIPVSDADDDGGLHLPPGERNDEAGDLLEWIANSTPEDTQAIRAEIKRLYFDVGDTNGAAALNAALSDVLEDPSTATRQSVLDNNEIYTHGDPADVGQFGRDLITGGLFGPFSGSTSAAVRSTESEVVGSAPTAEAVIQEGRVEAQETAESVPEGAAATQEGMVATQELPSPFWGLGWGTRGRAIHDAMGGSLPWWFKGIDDFRNGLATSFKSIDLTAATYQNAQNLASTVNRYVNSLAAFNGKSYAGWEVKAEQITGRALNLIIPKGSMTAAQRAIIDAATERAKSRGINLFVTPF